MSHFFFIFLPVLLVVLGANGSHGFSRSSIPTRAFLPPPRTGGGRGGAGNFNNNNNNNNNGDVRKMEPPKLILIGGCSGTGKSTFGMSVALDQGILKCISTDTLRSVMRSFIPPEISPALHRSSYEPANDLQLKPKPHNNHNHGNHNNNNNNATNPTTTTGNGDMVKEVEEDDPIKSWKQTCMVLHKCVEELVEEMMDRGASIVIEGVHLIPSNELIERWEARGGVATGIVLQVPDEQAHQTLLVRRGQTTGKGEEDKLAHFSRIRAIHDEMVRLGQEAGWLVIEQHIHPDPLDLVTDRLWKSQSDSGNDSWNPEKEVGNGSVSVFSTPKPHDTHDNHDPTIVEGTYNNPVHKRLST